VLEEPGTRHSPENILNLNINQKSIYWKIPRGDIIWEKKYEMEKRKKGKCKRKENQRGKKKKKDLAESVSGSATLPL
jgi:hypothetical protein